LYLCCSLLLEIFVLLLLLLSVLELDGALALLGGRSGLLRLLRRGRSQLALVLVVRYEHANLAQSLHLRRQRFRIVIRRELNGDLCSALDKQQSAQMIVSANSIEVHMSSGPASAHPSVRSSNSR